MLRLDKPLLVIEDVPSTWIFETYLNLAEKLHGQSIKIRSVFKTERTPSMCIYYSDDARQYRFKDFSSGKSGNGIALVSELCNIPYNRAIDKIINDYDKYIQKGDVNTNVNLDNDIVAAPRYKVTEVQTREWNNADAKFWVQFGISSDLLRQYNVKPIQKYVMRRLYNNDEEEIISIERPGVYGYFDSNGDLYKIYQPGQKSKKFIKVKDYVQGSDQLTESKCLIICSSLKDALAFKAMRFKGVDVIAPDSENSTIPKEYINQMLKRYSRVFTLFDDDVAGIKAMNKYKEKFQIPYLHLQMSKDLSDSVKDYGLASVKTVLYNMLKQAMK